MKTYIITITEAADPLQLIAVDDSAERRTIQQEPVEHYRRRVELPDIDAVIGRMDTALKYKPRRVRSDAGRSRTVAAQ